MAKPKRDLVKFPLRLSPGIYCDLLNYSNEKGVSINQTINIFCRHMLDMTYRGKYEKQEAKSNND